MALWIETKVRYDKNSGEGIKKVTEHYLVDALSCTEAEERITNLMTPYNEGELSVSSVIISNISEIFWDEQGDKWYKVKVGFITVDEKTGKEKQTPSYILVQAANLENALDNFLDGMKGTMADYEILAIDLTNIVDVYKYND